MMALAHGRSTVATVAVAASLMHVLNHAIFKGLLFLGAGSVVMAMGTRHLEQFGGLMRRMPWTGLCFLVGSLAISGFPLPERLSKRVAHVPGAVAGVYVYARHRPLEFPSGGSLLALTSALAAACFVRAFGISFLALPRSPAASSRMSRLLMMLVPLGFLAMLCVGFGLFPGFVLRALEGVTASLPGLQPPAGMVWGGLGMSSTLTSFDHVVPAMFGLALLGGLIASTALTARRGLAVRQAPTWGCGGELTPRSEYTATAFSKPLLMIFGLCTGPLDKSMPWRPCRNTSCTRFVTVRRSNRRSSGISMDRWYAVSSAWRAG